MKNIIIGISEGSKYFNYENWFKGEEGVAITKLSYLLDNFDAIVDCDGIILSGGHDINPRLYNQPGFLDYINPKDVDERRDEFEWKIMQNVEQARKPLLGICRGLQLVNVYYGGTLVPDIPAFGKFNHGKFKEGHDREHQVLLDPDSALCKIVGATTGMVNSAHHQSVDMPGFDLVVNALSPDGIVEGMERRDPDGKPFLLLVQWHPERMTNQDSVFSKNVKESFLTVTRGNRQ